MTIIKLEESGVKETQIGYYCLKNRKITKLIINPIKRGEKLVKDKSMS